MTSEKTTRFLPDEFSASLPAKTFLLGEYLALIGRPAVVATHSPRFRLATCPGVLPEGYRRLDLPPGSPAQKLVQFARTQLEISKSDLDQVLEDLAFFDPLQGAGGVGASSALFGMLYQSFAVLSEKVAAEDFSAAGCAGGTWLRNWHSVWSLFRELCQTEEGVSPSGYDLAAQWRGGISLLDPFERDALEVWPLMDWSSHFFFSATQGSTNTLQDRLSSRKTATHQHLSTLVASGFPHAYRKVLQELEAVSVEGVQSLKQGKLNEWGKSLTQYACKLQEAGLELESASEDREAFLGLPGVLGCKGTGALLSDGLVVCLDPQHDDIPVKQKNRERLLAFAQERGLVLLSEGAGVSHGITR